VTPPEHLPFDMGQLFMGQLFEQFPGDAALIARLLVQSDAFRNMCEDLVLAKNALMQLEAFQRERQPKKVAEYRQLTAELEDEIAKAIEHARQSV